MWDPARHLADSPEWLVDPRSRKRRQHRSVVKWGIVVVAVLATVLLLRGWPGAFGDLALAFFGEEPDRMLLALGVFTGLWLCFLAMQVATPRGCTSLAPGPDERPGMGAVRDARQAALRARRSLVALGAGLRERLVHRVDDLDVSVLTMSEVARGTSDPKVVTDLIARAREIGAVADQIEALAEGLSSERRNEEERLFAQPSSALLESADAGIVRASDEIAALSGAIEELRR
jgi:hypothetical protein